MTLYILMTGSMFAACEQSNVAAHSEQRGAGDEHEVDSSANENPQASGGPFDGSEGNPDSDDRDEQERVGGTGGTESGESESGNTEAQEDPHCLKGWVSLPSAHNAYSCECLDCLCNTRQCKFEDCSCRNPEADCPIIADEFGNGEVQPTAEGLDCLGAVSCDQEEEDSCNPFQCTITECEVPIESTLSNPAPKAVQASFEFTRNASMLIAVDTSGSMRNNQEASACAMQAFFDNAQDSWSLGIATQNVGPLFSSNGIPLEPHLVGLSDPECIPERTCSCKGGTSSGGGESRGTKCTEAFTTNGTMMTSEDAGARELLQKLIVQGGNESSDADEGGLEMCFAHVLWQLRNKQPPMSQCLVITDEQANSDRRVCQMQARRGPETASVLLEEFGIDFTPPANQNSGESCDDDLIEFYSAFFKKFNVQINAIVEPSRSRVYQAVAEATGGLSFNIEEHCMFPEFFGNIGLENLERRGRTCRPGLGDAAGIKVVYSKTQEVVPEASNGQDGWVPDPEGATDVQKRDCIVLTGEWAKKAGKFEVTVTEVEGVKERTECLEPTKSIRVTKVLVEAKEEVPQSSTDGWTFDPGTNCVHFHGSWKTDSRVFEILWTERF